MQAEGIAEADPSLDVDGWDAAAKTVALASVLMDADLTPQDIDRTGIGPDSAARSLEARKRGCRLRLVAAASRTADGQVSGSVRPVELPDDDLLARLRGKSNALILETDLLGDIAIHQLGGDVTMTAYALLSDLVTLRRRAS
jgi:homoserine dehydrogenase